MNKNGIPIIGQVPAEAEQKGKKIARVDAMKKSVHAHLNGIGHWFNDPKITLVVRNEEGDFIVTNDTAAEAISALERNEGRPVSAKQDRVDDLTKALDMALFILAKDRPEGVGDEFVAMASILTGNTTPECHKVLDEAKARIDAPGNNDNPKPTVN
jgi:hypothetical protein